MYYKYDYKCKVSLKIHKLFTRSVLDLSGKKRIPLDKERYLFIYTKKKLGLHSKIDIIYCLMGLEGVCKSTPNT